MVRINKPSCRQGLVALSATTVAPGATIVVVRPMAVVRKGVTGRNGGVRVSS